MKKRVLVLGYSQTGQLNRVLESIVAPLEASEEVEVERVTLEPAQSFPFPWPFLHFFDTFPECVYERPVELKPLPLNGDEDFDLIILGYQVWFLSPSLPVGTFLNSPTAERLFKDKPVMTVVACRNMWLMAQEKVKAKLENQGARLVDNVVLTDVAHSAFTFVSTPLWVLTGHKGPFLGGVVPEAGVPEEEVAGARRFGEAVARQLPARNRADKSMLEGLGAVQVQESLIGAEKIAHRSFRLWGALLRKLGEPGSLLRRAVLLLYIVFLVVMILTVVPISALLKRLMAPLLKERTATQRAYYAAPSGEAKSH